MPKRSNIFQRMVYITKKVVAPGDKVEESRFLVDRATGKEREVDICIETTLLGHPVLVGIECKDQKRPASVEWVEQQKAKHERLGTHALVLVSRNSFTAEAKKVAYFYGIETLAIESLNAEEIADLVGPNGSIWLKMMQLQPTICNAEVQIENDIRQQITLSPDMSLHLANGTYIGSAFSLVHYLLSLENVIEKFSRDGTQEHSSFEFGCEEPRGPDKQPIFLRWENPPALHKICSIQIRGACSFYITEFLLSFGKLGESAVAWGAGKIWGQNAILVASRDNEGVRRITVEGAGINWTG